MAHLFYLIGSCDLDCWIASLSPFGLMVGHRSFPVIGIGSIVCGQHVESRHRIDWSTWFATDTISTSTRAVPTGLTQVTAANTTTTATVWLSGGTLDTPYTVTNRIVTARGRTDERTIVLYIRDR